MTAQIAGYGRLGADPVQRQSQAGNVWATASIAVDLGEDDATMWLGVVAFGKVAENLCRHAKGDLVSVSGRLQLKRWTDAEGKFHERTQVVADTVISARTVRCGGGRRNGGSHAA